MEGLVKMAESAAEIMQTFIRRARQEANLTPQQVQELLETLKTKYGTKAAFEMLHPENIQASSSWAPEAVKMYRQQLGDLVKNNPEYLDKGFVMAGPHKEIILHEMGHSLDPKAFKDNLIGKTLSMKVAPTAGLYGGAVAPGIGVAVADNENENAAAVGGMALGAGAGGGLAYYGSKRVERAEDKANQFVRRYLADELGDVAKGEQAFKDSVLPLARKTYSKQTKRLTGAALASGVLGGLMGLGIAGAVKDSKRKKEENKMSEEAKSVEKIAAYTSNDPVWQMLEEHRRAKQQGYEDARAKLDPELVAKENTAFGYGLGGGAGVGGLAGLAAGAISGVKAGTGVGGKLLGGLGRGIVSGGVGALGGAVLGGIASTPFAMYYRHQQDPEVLKEVNQARWAKDDAAERLSDYEYGQSLIRDLKRQERRY